MAWDVKGERQDIACAPASASSTSASRCRTGLNLGFNPPFNRMLSWAAARSTATRNRSRTRSPPTTASRSTASIRPDSMGYNWQWNVSAQREIARNTTLEVGYVGSKGYDLLLPVRCEPGSAWRSQRQRRSRPSRFHPRGQQCSARAALRPYGVFGNASIAILAHRGDTTYHSLQTQLVSRFGHGSQFQASYTFSRTTGDVTLIGRRERRRQRQREPARESGARSGTAPQPHRPHIFNASLVLALPSLDDQSTAMKSVLGGWEVGDDRSGILRACGHRVHRRDSRPDEPCLRHRANRQSAAQPAWTDRTARPSSGPPEQMLNPDAFTLTGFQLGTFGNSPRGVCHGPDFFQTDLAFYKNFRISDQVKAQFRFEIFNVFNRVELRRREHEPEPDERHARYREPGHRHADYGLHPVAAFGQATAHAIRGRRSSGSS